jgi:ABC-type transporter Mla MlaB component
VIHVILLNKQYFPATQKNKSGKTQLRENVGIFSLFGKKDQKDRQQTTSADKDVARAKRKVTNTVQPGDASKAAGRSTTVKRDAQTARATALKIDAIESEMSSEFVTLTTITQTGNTVRGAPPAPAPANAASSTKKPAPPASDKPRPNARKAAPPLAGQTAGQTLQPLSAGSGTTTELLLDGTSTVGDIATPSSEGAAAIEEAAILYANGQTGLVEQMLQAAIAEDMLGDVTQKAWWMLFDLYQVTGKQQEFERLSIEYANKFETSPPTWTGNSKQETPKSTAASGAAPIVSFSGKLDGDSVKLTDRLRKLAETQRTLRLEFTRVTEVAPAGCRLLLDVLKTLQKSGHDLVLAGASELLDKVRAILEVGRREDTEDGWLLLLELLQLLNREKEFEEISIDYCVTFEVSPPAFVAPKSKITTAQAEAPANAAPAQDCFTMPALIEGRIDNLIVAIAAYADEHEPAIVDCAQLARVDFNAAGRLLTGLAPFCGNGKAVIEFHHVNHLVAELLNVIGLKDIVRILPRKN